MAVHDVSVLMDVRAGRPCPGGRPDRRPASRGRSSINATQNSNASDTRVVISARSTMSTMPTASERERVAKPPARADERRFIAVALARDERRDGGEVIRLERVAHAEERAEAGAGDEF